MAWHATLLQLGLEIIELLCKLQPLTSDENELPSVSNRMSLVHKHIVHLMAKKKKPSTEPRVFLLPLLATICQVQQSELNPTNLFFSFTETDCDYAQWKYPAYLLSEGKVWQSDRCTCGSYFHAVLRALCALKEAVDHGLETQTVCAVQWSLSVSWHQCTNVQYILCVCVCVSLFTCVKGHCSRVNVWWGNEALHKWNKNSHSSPSVPCDSSGQTVKFVLLKANAFSWAVVY